MRAGRYKRPARFFSASINTRLRIALHCSMSACARVALAGEFEPDLTAAARCLQASLVKALLPTQVRIDASLRIAKSLDCDKTMAWKLSRIARSPDPTGAAAHVPGSPLKNGHSAILRRIGVNQSPSVTAGR